MDVSGGVAESLGMAPEDEVLGEILALQSELARQVCLNRTAAAELLSAALKDVPKQQAEARNRAEAERDMDDYVQV